MWLLLAATLALADETPSDHAVIYYNARMALREGQPLEAVQLWLLRNALEDRTGQVSAHDADFRSVTWAALAELGVCQDGVQPDDDGAGLWPIALHNWIVRRMGRAPVKPPRPFRAFEVGRQQRRVAIDDVLGADDLATFEVARGRCLRPRLALLASGGPVTGDLSDPQVVAGLLLDLLEEARDTLAIDRVRGVSALDARRFDLHLQVAELAAREARARATAQARRGREVGMSRTSVAAMWSEAAATTLDPRSTSAEVLRACVDWPATEWMALSPDRRLFLFDAARAQAEDPAPFDRIALAILDRLVMEGQGAQAEAWIARVQAGPEVVWAGTRGERLLTLDPASGFRERAVIALHRGVGQLETGEVSGALRSFARALEQAPDSRATDDVHGLSRRWLSYAASRFALTDDLLVTLQALVPARDFSAILEDLMWRAALHAEAASFERGFRVPKGRGALERRLAMLTPLASGDLGGFSSGIREGLTASPSETVRFLGELIERLEQEEAQVRDAHVPTLARIRELVRPVAAAEGRQGRSADEVLGRIQALLEAHGGAVGTPHDRARALSLAGEVYAGSVRVAPTDPLPWPFRAAAVPAPSVFVPIELEPREWRDASGAWVLGWSLGG